MFTSTTDLKLITGGKEMSNSIIPSATWINEDEILAIISISIEIYQASLSSGRISDEATLKQMKKISSRNSSQFHMGLEDSSPLLNWYVPNEPYR